MAIQKSSPLIFAISFYIAANVINIIGRFVSISYSTSSTAPIGYIYAPFYSLIYCLPWLIVGYSIGYFVKANATKRRKDISIALVGGMVSLGYVGYSAYQFFKTQQLTETIISIMNNFQNSYLIEWGLSRNIKAPVFILESLANSRNRYTLDNIKSNRSTPKRLRELVIERLENRDYD